MMSKVFDPLRKLEVELTPEENVRQWFIGVLRDTAKVPVSLMMSEAGFKFGSKQYRADILIWNKNAAPLAVVECKKPSIKLSEKVLDQAVRYNMALELKWLILTNGNTTLVLKRNDAKFVAVNYLPNYEQMLSE